MARDLDIRRYADVALDPELMLIALEIAGEEVRHRRGLDPVALAAAAFAIHSDDGDEGEGDEDGDGPGHDGDDDDGDGAASAEEKAAAIGALACRLAALAETIERNRIAPGTYPAEAVAVGACRARLIAAGGRPAFQLLDLLAHVERAAAERPEW